MHASLKEELQQMEEVGIIQKSSSPYSSPVVVVEKKDEGNRICVDIRCLNKVTSGLSGSLFGTGYCGIGLQDINVQKMKDAPRHTTKKEIRSF